MTVSQKLLSVPTLGKIVRRATVAAAEMLPWNLLPMVRYSAEFERRKGKPAFEGFSIVVATRNRKAFLAKALESLISATSLPFEIIVTDNASKDGTRELCRELSDRYPTIVRYVRFSRNFGTNAYARGFCRARYRFLVDMDDDVLAVAKGWDRAVVQAFGAFPDLGFLALHPVQDEYTGGAMPERIHYEERRSEGVSILVGPTGGWFTVTTRDIYDAAGGFMFRPYKPFQPEDGDYQRRIENRGLLAAILKDKYVYHACGPYWNVQYGYQAVWKEKYRRDHRSFMSTVDGIQQTAPVSEGYFRQKVEEAETDERH